MRQMYDSVTASDIPLDAVMVAGYVNGVFEWSPEDWARFPTAVKVRIATRPTINDGHVIDVEYGDATPDQAVDWVLMRRSSGATPTVYCSLSEWETVKRAFRQAGVLYPLWWVAHYDNVADLPVGAVAKQYVEGPYSGGHYDLSIVADYWPGVDKGEIMGTITEETGSYKDMVRRIGALSGEVGDVNMSILLEDACYRIEAIIRNTVAAGGQSKGEPNQLAAKLDEILAAVKAVPTLDQIQQAVQAVLAQQIVITGDVKITGKTG